MNDDRLELEIRSMLAARDPGAAPAGLHFALRQIPTSVGRASSWNRVAGRLTPLAAGFGTLALLVGLVAVVGLVGLGRAPGPVGPGGTPVPQASWVPFDPTADGSGIASAPNDVPISIVLIACGVLAVVATVRTKSRRRRAAASVVIGLAMVTVFNLRFTPLVGWDGGGGAAGIGYIGSTGGLVADADIFAIGPYAVLTFGFDLTNTGRLPIDLIGLAPDPVGGAWAVGMGPSQTSVGAGSIRVTAAGLLRDPNSYSLLPADTRQWERVHLSPGDRQFLVLAVRAGPCALGRDNRGDDFRIDDTLERVGVVYDVLGIETMATVTLPRPISIPRQVNNCPAP